MCFAGMRPRVRPQLWPALAGTKAQTNSRPCKWLQSIRRRMRMKEGPCETVDFNLDPGSRLAARRSGLWTEYVQPERPEFWGQFHIEPEHPNRATHSGTCANQQKGRSPGQHTTRYPNQPEH